MKIFSKRFASFSTIVGTASLLLANVVPANATTYPNNDVTSWTTTADKTDVAVGEADTITFTQTCANNSAVAGWTYTQISGPRWYNDAVDTTEVGGDNSTVTSTKVYTFDQPGTYSIGAYGPACGMYTDPDTNGTDYFHADRLSVRVWPVPQFDSETLSFGDSFVGDSVNWSSAATDATEYSVTAGALPAGLSLDTSSGQISGSPAESGNYDFTIEAKNPGASATREYTGLILDAVTGPAPTIGGIARLNQTVTAGTDGWTSGADLSFQWNLDGTPISGAINRTYKIANSDLGHMLSVTVTGTMAGLVSHTLTSDASAVGTAVVTIFGTANLGQVLTVDPGTWPVGTVLSYQWHANKKNIGDNSNQYTITVNDIQSRISVTVSGTVGGRLVSKTSKPTRLVLLQRLTYTPAPFVFGDTEVDGWVCAGTDDWGTGVNLNIQWYRNGYVIEGATNWCYYPQTTDHGQMITAKITGSKPGYIPVRTTSNAVRIWAGYLGSFDTPVVVGDQVVGNTLTVGLGNLDGSDYSIAYQWFDNGKKIIGATGNTYTIPAKKQGHFFSVRLKVSYPHYETQYLYSND